MQAFLQRGRNVRAFKCGPDYIDPMFHQNVIGVSSRNLDTFFSDEDQIRELFARDAGDNEISVVEGVMGLYDGLGGIEKEGSAYHLAQVLDIPIVLVLDAHGMGSTVLSLLAGILSYDEDHRIAGVILNRTSESFCAAIRGRIEEKLHIPVLGYFPNRKDIHLESRHLGLKMPQEIENWKEQLQRLAEILENCVSIDKIEKLAMDWKEKSPISIACLGGNEEKDIKITQNDEKTGVRIAVAMDEVFCFYYEDNLRMLREQGAVLVPFSPLQDTELPEDVHGILLGGGYPELRAKELSQNVSMGQSIRCAIENGVPSVAECGGFMYLHETMEGEDEVSYPMAGVIPASCHNKKKLVRFGYVEIAEQESGFLPENSKIKGHEFHYYDSSKNGTSCTATKPISGKSWQCVHTGEDHWWGFPHLYYPSNPYFVSSFIEKCRMYKTQKDRKENDRTIHKKDDQLEYSLHTAKSEIMKEEKAAAGKLYGIGVGPGESSLLTLKAIRTIESCDVLIYPAASKEECYAYRIVVREVPEVEEKPYCCLPFPMVREAEKLEKAHREIYEQIASYLNRDKKVGLMTIGDPTVYSTYMYMHERAKEEGFLPEIISGVPSFCAAAARLGISLGEKTDEIHIIPASYDVRETLQYTGTRIYMKSGKKLTDLIGLLREQEKTLEKNRTLEVYGVSNCGMEDEQVYYGLKELEQAKGYLVLVIVKYGKQEE